jgi:hypothetical protein
MRFKSEFWSGIYELAVREPGKAEPKVVPLQGKIYPPGYSIDGPATTRGEFGSPGWRALMPELNLVLASQEPDTVLSSLALLTDPEQACRFLEKSIREQSPAYRDLSIQACTPKVVRYKPGSRCTILYPMEYPPDQVDGRWPHLVVAKTYRNEKGQNAYDSMQALWNSPLGSSQTVTIAEPLAYHPEMRVLLQGPIREERTLKELISWAVSANTQESLGMLEDMMRKTAAGLAAVHGSGVQVGKLWTWEDELGEVRDRIERLGESIPSIAHAADPLLAQLKRLASSTPLDELVPSHGSFRPAQVLIYQGQIGFIDFDSFGQSEPALDLALFLSTVKSIGLDTSDYEGDQSSEPLEEPERTERYRQMVALCDLFLDEYERTLPVSRQRVALWEALNLIMLVLHGWIKIKTFRIQDCTFLLEHHLNKMGI